MVCDLRETFKYIWRHYQNDNSDGLSLSQSSKRRKELKVREILETKAYPLNSDEILFCRLFSWGCFELMKRDLTKQESIEIRVWWEIDEYTKEIKKKKKHKQSSPRIVWIYL